MTGQQREIKFRAWDKKMKKMFEVQVIGGSGKIVLYWGNEKWRQVNEDCILMQYTGLKDKNGKEIYEGDILGAPLTVLDTKKPKRFRIFWKGIGFKEDDLKYGGYRDADPSYYRVCKVIGNIYENKSLLKNYGK